MTQACSQRPDQKYFNETTPGTTPAIFAPRKISTPEIFEFGAVFSDDQHEFYYSTEIDGKAETWVMEFAAGEWSTPSKVLTHETYSFNDPMLTPDGKKLFFISNRTLTGTGPKKDYDIWYIERDGGKWSEPKNAGPNINSPQNEYYISFTRAGKMYFGSNREQDNYDIYSADIKNGKFETATKLGPGVNTSSYEADVFVSPDESYIVFAANRPGGLGVGDLYVSFRQEDGTWGNAKSLGDSINTETDDFCPYVTPDGKYLMYASRGDIYWVSTEIIKQLR
ncbi:hypothetical protein DQQ10_06445 [Pseudochryseolinea flava]|uniref:WD40-like Beta Propeller Repeat n=2 Tax=Pseudochryseolinea flava TaxID=2059302 RepID=A0A364Y9B3_9BACT|nr:hypothetical protein DQQ10_06445 [Pseudochryseolinea flava]